MRTEDRRDNISEHAELRGTAFDRSGDVVGVLEARAFRNGKSQALPSPRARLGVQPRSAANAPLGPVGLAVSSTIADARPTERSDPSSWAVLNHLPVPSEARLRQLFDLTPAEARLAQGLARGDALEEVAGELKIKMTTARSQLAAIFSKTQTRRQAGLVAILSRLAHVDELHQD
jgi:DNA-binding CsgD family transcriptional regulator